MVMEETSTNRKLFLETIPVTKDPKNNKEIILRGLDTGVIEMSLKSVEDYLTRLEDNKEKVCYIELRGLKHKLLDLKWLTPKKDLEYNLEERFNRIDTRIDNIIDNIATTIDVSSLPLDDTTIDRITRDILTPAGLDFISIVFNRYIYNKPFDPESEFEIEEIDEMDELVDVGGNV